MHEPSRHPQGGARRLSGFSLVELLVVIAVFAVLLSLLLPSLLSARRGAQAVQCLSRCRQLGIACQAYCVDNDGRLPPHNTIDRTLEDPNFPGQGANVAWCWAQISGDIDTAFRNGSLSDYLDDVTTIAGCPAWETPASAIDWGVTTPFFNSYSLPLVVHYGYNGRMLGENLGGGVWASFRISDLKQADSTVIFTDSGQMSTGLSGTAGAAVWPEWELQPAARGTHVFGGNTVHGRHPGETANVLWGDGHASKSDVETAFATEEQRAFNIGTIDPTPDEPSNENWGRR